MPNPEPPPANNPSVSEGMLEAAIQAWLRQAARAPLLTAAEESRLARLIPRGRSAAHLIARDGDRLQPRERTALAEMVERGRLARERLTAANLRLVISVARRYSANGMSLDDLIQEGNIGLLRAVEKFNPEHGTRFSTYAVWWIRQAVTRAISDQGRCIRVPSHMVARRNQVLRARNTLTMTLGREPTVDEIAAHMELSAEKVLEASELTADPISLETPISAEDAELLSILPGRADDLPERCLERTALKESVQDFLCDVLTERERQVLSLRYGLADGAARTLEEVGSAVGVTRERIRQIETRAMRKLRSEDHIPRLHSLIEE